jgi:hypothetical protein
MKFIVAVYIDEDDTSPKYFATTPFFKRLQASLKESNPYFVSYALQDEYVVKYYLSQVQKTFQMLVPLEAKDGVKFKQNNFIVWDGDTKDALGRPKTSVDYEALVQFINWCLTPPNPNDVDSVWPISKLTEFEFGIADKDGNFISKGKYDNMNKIQDLRDELIGIETEILQIQTELKNPRYGSLNLTNILAGGIGAGAAAAGLGLLGGSLGALGALTATTTVLGGATLGVGGVIGIAAPVITTAATGLGTAATILGAVGGPIGIGVALVIGLGLAIWGSSSKKEAQNKRVAEVANELIARLSLITNRRAEILRQIAEIEANINKPTTTSAGVKVTNTTTKTSTTQTTSTSQPATTEVKTGGSGGAPSSGGSGRREQLYDEGRSGFDTSSGDFNSINNMR